MRLPSLDKRQEQFSATCPCRHSGCRQWIVVAGTSRYGQSIGHAKSSALVRTLLCTPHPRMPDQVLRPPPQDGRGFFYSISRDGVYAAGAHGCAERRISRDGVYAGRSRLLPAATLPTSLWVAGGQDVRSGEFYTARLVDGVNFRPSIPVRPGRHQAARTARPLWGRLNIRKPSPLALSR